MIPIIPQIGPFIQGRDYDFATAQSTTHETRSTKVPVEDRALSIISDHTKHEPVRIAGTFAVSTIVKGSVQRDETRPARFYEALLDLQALQTVDPTALLEIYTGLIVVPNMRIASIREGRQSDRDSQKPTFDVVFEELPIAEQPARADIGLVQVGTGRRADASLQDRAILERPVVNNRPPISIDLGLPSAATATGAADGRDVVADAVAATVPGGGGPAISTAKILYDNGALFRNRLIADFLGGVGLDKLADAFRPR